MHKDNLIKLYQNTSKHSNYQILASAIKKIVPEENLSIHSRFEYERFSFLKENLDFEGKNILDVGGNTGFFSFEILDMGANKVVYIEGNKAHADFVSEAAEILNANLVVQNMYLNFDESLNEKFDVVLLFNVIHHLGDDFGEKHLNIENAKEKMAECMNYFSDKTDYMVLQMGFCWKGDRTKLLFENGTKEEMIQFIKNAIGDKWTIRKIGIAELIEGRTIYKEITETNIQRNDSMGEFRNRPIFILKKNNCN